MFALLILLQYTFLINLSSFLATLNLKGERILVNFQPVSLHINKLRNNQHLGTPYNYNLFIVFYHLIYLQILNLVHAICVLAYTLPLTV